VTLTLPQGATRTIVISGITDANSAPLDVTGWAVHAQIRRATGAPVLAEWVSGTPTGTQGQATAAGDVIRLEVPHSMSEAWTWTVGKLQVEITEPGPGGRRERIADEQIVLDPEIVR
jgi:hypothetical protein